jgi:hypothetical protein
MQETGSRKKEARKIHFLVLASKILPLEICSLKTA